MIPIGATVRWVPAVSKDPWSDRVVGHPAPRMVQVAGGSRISESLLEVVGEMTNPFDEMPPLAEQYPNGTVGEQLDAARAEIAALTALVVEQGEALAEMVPAPTHDEQQHLEDVEAFADNAAAYLETYLSAEFGNSRPLLLASPELKALADFIFEGVQ